MLLHLEGVLRPGGLPPRVAVGDYPERLGTHSTDREPRVLDLLPPVTVNGRLERPGLVDRFQFPVEPGQRYRIAVQAEAFGSRLDGVLKVTDQAGRQLALVDDVVEPPIAPGFLATTSTDPLLDLTVPVDVRLVKLELRDQRGRGGVNFGYRLTVAPSVPDFSLRIAAGELNVPRGGSAPLTVAVNRRGYLGAILLEVKNLPAGWFVRGGNVPANVTTGLLTVSAPMDAIATEPPPLTLAGRSSNQALSCERRPRS